jgi:histidyl-tRNA synthetase
LVVIAGDSELASGTVQVREMREKTQREVAIAELIETLAPTAYAEGG